jgi:hypothetical protein
MGIAMIQGLFYLSLVAVGLSILGFIALSIFGGILEKSIKDGAKKDRFERTVKKIAFTLFLILGFSIVPVMVGIFFPLLQNVVPIDISFLADNDMLLVAAAWAIYIIGLVILLPEVKKDFFSESIEGAGPAGVMARGMPPLDDLINDSGAVVLATTDMKSGRARYSVSEVWKLPLKGFSVKKGDPMDISTKPFELRGYSPLERQLVVFFLSGKPPNGLMELLPVIGDYVMYAPADTKVQEYLELAVLKKRVLR